MIWAPCMSRATTRLPTRLMRTAGLLISTRPTFTSRPVCSFSRANCLALLSRTTLPHLSRRMSTRRLTRHPALGLPLLPNGVVLSQLLLPPPSVLPPRLLLLPVRLTGIGVPMSCTSSRLLLCHQPTVLTSGMPCVALMPCVVLVPPRPALARSLVGPSRILLVLALLLARLRCPVPVPILRLTPCLSWQTHRHLRMSVPPVAAMHPSVLLPVDLFLLHLLVLRLPELLMVVRLLVALLLPTDTVPSLLPPRSAPSVTSVPRLLARATLTSSTITVRSLPLQALVPLVSPPALLLLLQLRLLLRPLLVSVARSVRPRL